MSDQFSQTAARLLNRISTITCLDKKDKHNDTTVSSLNSKPEMTKTIGNRSNGMPTSPETQTLLELSKIQQEMLSNQDENYRKIKSMNEEVRKIENLLKDEADTRIKIHESFLISLARAEKGVNSTLTSIKKLYSERERRLHSKIEQILNQERKFMLEQLQKNNSLSQDLSSTRQAMIALKEEIVQMKRTRMQLEDKISRQFNDQISALKTVFCNSIRVREERELKILDMLKAVYKKHMDAIKKEQIEREANEKMFLTVIEQLVNRIAQV